MKPKISIGSCQRAIGIVGGSIPVMIRGEQVLITRARATSPHGLSSQAVPVLVPGPANAQSSWPAGDDRPISLHQ